MADRGLLLSGPMVRQALAGLKLSTMRPMTRQNAMLNGKMPAAIEWAATDLSTAIPIDFLGKPALCASVGILTPRYQLGDRIWFREAFSRDWCDHTIYRADGGSARAVGYASEPKWTPGIHMPRWACRLERTMTEAPYPRRPCDLTAEEEAAEGFPLPANDPDAPGDDFRAFWRRLHKDAPMDQWCWMYPGLVPVEETAR